MHAFEISSDHHHVFCLFEFTLVFEPAHCDLVYWKDQLLWLLQKTMVKIVLIFLKPFYTKLGIKTEL